MALILNEEQQMLRDSARSFLQEHSPVSAVRQRRDAGTGFAPELWAAMAEMGWSGIVIPEQFGGLEFGYVGAGLLFEECGRTLATSPLLSSALVCASLLTELGSEEQRQAILPAVAAGELILSLALDEGPRFDPAVVALSATSVEPGYVLDGRKQQVINGCEADKLIVVARTAGAPGDEDGLSLFMLDRNTHGLTIESALNVDSQNVASIGFDSVQLDAGALLGEVNRAWPALQRALDIGAACVAAETLGIAQEAFERTVEYLQQRQQFGSLIGTFQSLQHRAAELFCELELCKSVVLKALQAIDEDSDDRAMLVSVAKAKTGKTAQLAVNEAVQMHGGIGMTDEFDIGFFMKRTAVTRQHYGDYFYHADRFARLRAY